MKNIFNIIILIILVLIFVFIDITIGSSKISIIDIWNSLLNINLVNSNTILIIKEIRIPRIITALVVGISLPVSGLLLQTLFKNPLAGPYILGISSGASLGVAILLLGLSLFGISVMPDSFSIAIAGIVGAGLILLIILLISLRINNSLTILIIGVLLGSGINSIVNLLQYFGEANLLKKYIIWTMGSLDGVQKEQLTLLVLTILSLVLVSIFISKYIDALYLGDENASTLGVNVKLLRITIFVITGIMTGLVTAYCGPIGFVGIAVPHIARLLYKTSKHFYLIIYSTLIGAILLLISDIISHSFSNNIIPINTITAISGIPFIIWVVFKNKTQ